MIPETSIIYMGISAFLTIALPIGLYLFWRKKYHLRIMPMLIGASLFFVSVMILEALLHSVVLAPDENGAIALLQYPALYVIYAVLAAGIFEESARFLAFKVLKGRYSGLGTGLAYGIGHGGIEAVLLVGVNMLVYIGISNIANSGNMEVLNSVPDMDQMLAVLSGTPDYMFLVGGFERVLAISAHIALSVIMWLSVNKDGKKWLYPAAIVLHAVLNIPAALMQCGVIENVFLVEALTLVGAGLIVAFAVLMVKKTNEEASLNSVY